MKEFLILVILFLTLSCEETVTESRNYPRDNNSDIFLIKKIDLDTTNFNFKQITSWVSGNDYSNRLSLIEIIDGGVKKRIFPHSYAGCFFSERNIIRIKSDSILKDSGYPIDYLKPILSEHYLNIPKNYPYSKSSQFAMVEITIDTSKTATELKNLLIKVTQTFDEINAVNKDSLELRIYFDYFRQMPSPPAPPRNLEPVIDY
ncbi:MULTISPECIES: hypothetical protein [Bizionia]|uniref:Uncharacterized protein n=1 Tax=Bizionia algoritergicola TaxID=291187 RepID=A0A5D0R0S1_9FLAO|nr:MULTISPECIES: hypothetical protein [Bizionia]OBX21579.1 hypothetical protein BAA08_12155 [Bizionia sp. APA-3]TYB75130.1 hypothetical protein ES675_03085 [Bizionia algoritergicola]